MGLTLRALLSMAAVAALGLASACTTSNASPTPTTPTVTTTPTTPPTPTVQSVALSATLAPFAQAGATTQAIATATLSTGITTDVTSTCANWATDNANVLTVSATGLLTERGVGSATITALCGTVTGRGVLTVIAAPMFTLNGIVTDGTSGGILPNITMQITSVANSATTHTDGSGAYAFTGLAPGLLTLSASNVAYVAMTQSVSLAANTRVDLVIQRAPPPIDGTYLYDLTLQINSLTSCVNQSGLPVSPGSPVPVQSFAGNLTVSGGSLQYVVLDPRGSLQPLVKLAFQRSGNQVSGSLTGNAIEWPGSFHDGVYLGQIPASGLTDSAGRLIGTAQGTWDDEGFPAYLFCNVQFAFVLAQH